MHIIVHLFVLFLLFAHNCANKYKIDNISASLSLNRFISLHYLAVHSRNIRFNPERFPGGIFKFQDHRGTVIIFTSGCVNILGCKNEEQILRLWKKLTSTLASLAVWIMKSNMKVFLSVINVVAVDQIQSWHLDTRNWMVLNLFVASSTTSLRI